MSVTSTYAEEPVVVGSTVDWTVYARLNGETWDLTGATVDLYLEDPSGNQSTAYAGTVSDPSAGKAHYLSATSVVDEAGTWRFLFRLEKSGVVKYTRWYELEVYPGVS